jgi:hypothetical protein
MIIFDNCLITAPDGQALSRCGLKKLQWYLDRDLAELIADNPPTIRLRFEPSGRRGLDDPLLLDGKPNECVVCGVTEDLTRHHLIPYSFIKHMEVEYKMDIIRDIFPLCRSCHNNYEKKSYHKREELAQRFNVPMNGLERQELLRVHRAMSASIALSKHQHKMPPARREELFVIVRNFLNKEEITNEDLKQISNYRVKERPDYVTFSRYVAQHVTDYNEFAKEWREHFVAVMQPKFMPKKWRVDRITKDVWVPERVLRQERKTRATS